MKHQIKLKKSRGFSLVEMLVVIAVIGIIAGIAVPSIGSVSGKANEAKAKRNGQTIASLYNASRGVGASYTADTTSGIIDELVAGKGGPELAGTEFKMSAMPDDEKTAAMKYVSYDADADLMSYDPAGVQEQVQEWGEWRLNGGGYPTQARAQLQNESIAHYYPDAEFKVEPSQYSSGWDAWRREPL